MTDRELIRKIEKIQEEWWEGDVESNVALSEIRYEIGAWGRANANQINPVCGVPGCDDPHYIANPEDYE